MEEKERTNRRGRDGERERGKSKQSLRRRRKVSFFFGKEGRAKRVEEEEEEEEEKKKQVLQHGILRVFDESAESQ